MSIFNANDNDAHIEWRSNLLHCYFTIIKNMYELKDALADNKQIKNLPQHEAAIIKSNNIIIKELYKAIYDTE
jgi:hypothetical protein